MRHPYFKQQNQENNKKQKQIVQTRNPETSQKKQFNLMVHNKIKIQYSHHEYKNVYDKLLKMDKPETTLMPLYLQDIICSVNKMLREYIIHKEVYANGNMQACIHQGKDSIQKLYQLFFLNDTFIHNTKNVNAFLNKQITRFFIVTLNFIMNLAFISSLQSKLAIAKSLYQVCFQMSLQIISSSPSNYKLLIKTSQCLLAFGSFLIDYQQIDRSITVLFLGLRNETNILIMLSIRIKNKSRSEIHRRKLQLFNRLYAIFFNLTVSFQLKGQFHWCYLCLQQCKLISELKVSLLQKDIKINWYDIIHGYEKFYNEYQQITKITQVYFSIQQIREEIDQKKKYELTTIYQQEQTPNKEATQRNINHNQTTSIHEIQKKQRGILRRSVSLQNSLDQSEKKLLYKDFGQQILFYGFNFLQKNSNTEENNNCITYKTRPASKNHNQTQKGFLLQEKLSKLLNHQQSKLKKKPKKIQNTLFKKIKQPVECNVLKQRVQKCLYQQEKENNKQKEKIYLLKYKSQYLNYKKIAEEDKKINQQIQMWNKKSQNSIKEKNRVGEPESQEKQKGINLFKRIILTYANKLNIKRSQTFNILKRKQNKNKNIRGPSYSQPQESVNYLLDRLKKQKDKNQNLINTKIDTTETKKQKTKINGTDNVFLTKNTVQISNIFLSFISPEDKEK